MTIQRRRRRQKPKLKSCRSFSQGKTKRMKIKPKIISFVISIVWVAIIDVELSCARGSEIHGPNSYVFVGFYAGGAGPMPVSPVNRFLVVSADGRGQAYEVANSPVGDQLVSLEEKQVDANKLFDYLSKHLSQLPSSPVHPPKNDGMADEYVAPNVEVAIKMSQDKAYHWEGQEKELPKKIKELVNLVENNLHTGQAVSVKKPYAFLVANWLNPLNAAQYRREGMLYAVGSGTNSASAFVLASLQHPFQLIPVNQETNPFVRYCRNFNPGLQTLEASYLGKDFQIRSVAITTNSKIGVINESK